MLTLKMLTLKKCCTWARRPDTCSFQTMVSMRCFNGKKESSSNL